MTLNRGRMLGTVLMAACAALGVASCTIVPAPAREAASHPGTPSARAVSASTRSPKQRAEADMAAILRGFVPPPGAHQVPRLSAATLQTVMAPTPVTPDVVTGTTWWLAPGNPQQVLAWEAGHVPRLFRLSGSGTAGPGTWDDDFDLPNVPGVLVGRDLSVATASAGDGRTGIRVDAVSAWLPVRPVTDRIPSAAGVVTFSQGLGLNAHGKQPPAAATVTDQAKVSQIAALIDAQPLFPPGQYNCPADDGQFLRLTFRAKAGGPVLAVAALATSGCAGIAITAGGKQQPELGPAVGRTTAAQVLKIAGLSWRLPAWP